MKLSCNCVGWGSDMFVLVSFFEFVMLVFVLVCVVLCLIDLFCVCRVRVHAL